MNISEQELVFAIGCMQASYKGIFFFFLVFGRFKIRCSEFSFEIGTWAEHIDGLFIISNSFLEKYNWNLDDEVRSGVT